MRKGSHGVTAPFILGREGVGVVEAVGAGIGTVKVGDRVAYTSLAGGTSKSATCRSGRDSSVCCRCHARQRGR